MSNFNQKRKAIVKSFYLQAGGFVPLLGQKRRQKAAHEFDLHKSFYQSTATAIRVPVIFFGNVFNLEAKNYAYGRGKL